MESNQLQDQQSTSPYIEEIDLQRYWLAFKRHWLPAAGVFSAVVALSALYAMTRTPSYAAGGKLLIQTDRSSALTGLSPGSDIGQVATLYPNNNPLDTQAAILRSVPVVEEAIAALDLRDEEGEPMSPVDVLTILDVKPVPGADILEVSFASPEPELSASIVNAVMESYTRKNIADNRAEAVAAREFIQQQLPIAEEAVNDAEIALRDFKEANQIVALEQEATYAVETIAGLDNQLATVQADLLDATAQSQELRRQVGMSPEQAADLSRLNQAPGVQEALTNLQNIQAQLAVERTRYRDTHPSVANLVRQEESLSGLLQQRVVEVLGQGTVVTLGDLQVGTLRQDLTANLAQAEVTRLGLEQRLASLAETRRAFQQQANTFPGLEKTQRELERQLLAAQTTYEALLTRLQEIRVAENQNVGNARVIEAAVIPEEPSGTSKNLFLAAGIVAGALLAVATTFLLDLLDGSLKTVKDVKNAFGFSVLGIIPTFTNALEHTNLNGSDSKYYSDRVVVQKAPHSSVSSAYQIVQANIQLLCGSHRVETLVVSSTLAGEGKSEVCANLAAAIAQVGTRVLLVDANLRAPSQHQIWNLNNTVGLSNVVVDQVEVESAITEVLPRLSVLPSGVVPPNPLSLLSSQRMQELIKYWSKKYDIIIFDAPSLSGSADASILARYLDATVIVVNPGLVTGDRAKASREFLKQSNINVLGMVLNGVDTRNEPDSSFYYVENRAPQPMLNA